MAIIYLDQNKWIELAKVLHGKDPRPEMQKVLSFVQDTGRARTHVYPLSAVHYMETNRVREPGRRYRLGIAMWSLSRGRRISLGQKLLVYELELALARRFEGVTPTAFSLLGRGVAFAFDQPRTEFEIPPRAWELHPASYIELRIEAALESFERSCLTGEDPAGGMMPPNPRGPYAQNFMTFLATLGDRFSVISANQWNDGLNAVSIVDILDPLNDALRSHGLSLDQLLALGREQVLAFMDELPSRRVDMHLQKQILRNPSLKPKPTDLEDWGALGPAAAHCDVLVCEKHFADMLLRDGFAPKALVLTSLADLPSAA